MSLTCLKLHTGSPRKTSCRAAANHCKSIPLQHFWVCLPYLDSIPFQWWRPSEHGLGEIWTQRLQGDLLIRGTLHLGFSNLRYVSLLRFPPELGRCSRCCMPWRSYLCELICWTCFASTSEFMFAFVAVKSVSWTDYWKFCRVSVEWILCRNFDCTGANSYWLPTSCPGHARLGTRIRGQTDQRGRTPTWGGSRYVLHGLCDSGVRYGACKVVLRWPTRQPHDKLLTFSGYFGTISLVWFVPHDLKCNFQWLVVDPFPDLVAQEKSRDETCHVRFGDTFHTVSQILVYLGNEG